MAVPMGEITRALVGVRRRLCVKWGFVDMDMLTTIYNAPTTIDTYYDALVRHDMSHGYLEGGFKKLKMKREEGE